MMWEVLALGHSNGCIAKSCYGFNLFFLMSDSFYVPVFHLCIFFDEVSLGILFIFCQILFYEFLCSLYFLDNRSLSDIFLGNIFSLSLSYSLVCPPSGKQKLSYSTCFTEIELVNCGIHIGILWLWLWHLFFWFTLRQFLWRKIFALIFLFIFALWCSDVLHHLLKRWILI